MNFLYLRENYREIILQGTRKLWQRFPEAALLNLVQLPRVCHENLRTPSKKARKINGFPAFFHLVLLNYLVVI
jgi:hypothetical protein